MMFSHSLARSNQSRKYKTLFHVFGTNTAHIPQVCTHELIKGRDLKSWKTANTITMINFMIIHFLILWDSYFDVGKHKQVEI